MLKKITYTNLLEEYNKIKKQNKMYKKYINEINTKNTKNTKNEIKNEIKNEKNIEIPKYMNMNEIDYPPQAF